MHLRPDLSTRISQGLRLTPGLRQGLAILRMPAADLVSELRRVAAENPLVRLVDPDPVAQGSGWNPAEDIAAEASLGESLCAQIALMPLDAKVTAMARFLSGDIDDDGFLDPEAGARLQQMGAAPEAIAAAIEALQACDPAGVAARSLGECLALQLREQGLDETAARAACARLDLLAERRIDRLAAETGLDPELLTRMAELLPGLNPRPGADIAHGPVPAAPEVLVEDAPGGAFTATLDRHVLPRAEFDNALSRGLASHAAAQRAREEAQNLVGALKFRERTLQAVVGLIVTHQHRFFAEGPERLEPMTRADMARTLGLHPSTVGRALADKALSFRGAVHPLSRFVAPALASHGEGLATAYGVQRRIRRLIEAESACSILSDDEIAAVLRAEGVDIARRTVAKYRQCLTIPSSFARRKQKARQA